MTGIFIHILNMSMTASFVILVVMFLRLLLKHAPRIFSYFLWIVVFIRLLCPVSVEMDWGVIPYARLMEAGAGLAMDTWNDEGKQVEGSWQISEAAGEGNGETETDTGKEEINKKPIEVNRNTTLFKEKEGVKPDRGMIWFGASILWLAGCAAFVLYGTVNYGRWMLKLKGCKDQYGYPPVIISEEIREPFVAGWIKPAIYLPANLTGDQQKMAMEHEKIHILRKDYLIKPAAYLALCIHWFNPLVWLAFYFMEQDMETACDEAVLKRIGYENKKAYAHTLLLFLREQERCRKPGCPIAFGENSVKTRIENVVKQKAVKPWVVAVISVVIAAAAALLLVDGRWKLQVSVEEKETPQKGYEEENLAGDEAGTIDLLPAEQIFYEDIPSESMEITTHEYFTSDSGEDTPEKDDVTEHTYYAGVIDSYEVLLRQDKEPGQITGYHVPVEVISISNDYGYREHPVTQEKLFHSGVDFAAEEGTSVNAAEDGTVFETGWDDNCGNYVILLHENGEMTYYANCGEILAQDGQEVKQGEQIATVGNSGKSTGPHLHFALSRDGRYIEPIWIDEMAE